MLIAFSLYLINEKAITPRQSKKDTGTEHIQAEQHPTGIRTKCDARMLPQELFIQKK